MTLLVLVLALGDEHTVARTIDVAGVRRAYLLHVPPGLAPDRPAPVVLGFHGGYGEGRHFEKESGLSTLSDREGFIAAYPDGANRHWNDGRGMSDADDVGFVAALLDALATERAIDANRVFATGISNGAIFSHYLAAKLSTRIAAIAPVVGGLSTAAAESFKPDRPVAVCILQGTDDPITPTKGGEMARGRRGTIVETAEAVRLWAGHNGCAREPVVEELPDRDPKDGTRVTRSTWAGPAPVVLYAIAGGGHSWPGGSQYLPARVVGRVCRDIDATAVIWDFFKANGRR